MTLSTLQLSSIFAGALFFWVYTRARQSKASYPPGPKPHFLWKNILDYPQDKPWLVFEKWKKEYGDVVHLDLLGKHMVILNSIKACTDLLEKRSNLYSDRPRFVMLVELMGFGFGASFKGYTPQWRMQRRMFHQYLHEQIVKNYDETKDRHIHAYLKRLLRTTTPQELQEHTRLLFACITLDVTYGIQVTDFNDRYVQTAEKALEGVAATAIPGEFLVEAFPALKYVPSWFPGAGFQKKAADWKPYVLAMKNRPFKQVQEQMKSGKAKPCIVSSLLSDCEDGRMAEEARVAGISKEELIDLVAESAGSAYAAGADTTLSSLHMFFVLMAKYPEIQSAAQAELDDVIGKGRLPTAADMASLPYIRALVSEMLRWHLVLPLSFPHAVVEDDMYDGYYIPKGTIVVPNCWAMARDPELYPDPHTFKPSRWLTTDSEGKRVFNNEILSPRPFSFGFGRRRCPGEHLAFNTLITVTSYVLACFDISPMSGEPEDVVMDVTSGAISYPTHSDVALKPRSADMVQLVEGLD